MSISKLTMPDFTFDFALFFNSFKLCKGKDSVSKDLFVREVFKLVPRLFNGVHWWILRTLSKLQGSNQIALHYKVNP